MNVPTDSMRALHLNTRVLVLDACITALEHIVDTAWETQSPCAEELDAELAEARRRHAEVEAELIESEDSGDAEAPEYHEGVGVEEQLIVAYAHYLRNDSRGPFAGREGVLSNMRAVLEDAARGPIGATDEQILDAARDAFESELERRRRRSRASPSAVAAIGMGRWHSACAHHGARQRGTRAREGRDC